MNRDLLEWINQVASGKETGFSLQHVSLLHSRRKDHWLVKRLERPSGRYLGVPD